MTPKNEHPLKRDGTGQRQRFPAALDSSYAKVDERSVDDLLRFAAEYAKEVKFFDASNTPNGDWQNLFDKKLIEDIHSRSDIQPHYALFIAFLRLFQNAQNDLNQFTRRHLDFYYQQVLRLTQRDGQPDKVHVIFELAKNVSGKLIPKGTPVDAGKKLQYKLDDQIIVNEAKISDLRSIYRLPQENEIIRFASQANSGDGIGGPLDKNNPQWDAFGNNDLPSAQIGFAIASPVLLLKEGSRTISIEISLSDRIEIPEGNFSGAFVLYFSGEKEWIGPIASDASFNRVEGTTSAISITCLVDANQPSVENFDGQKLSGNFITVHPVIQIKIALPAALAWLKNAKIDSVKVDVAVSGVTSLSMENDQGTLNSKKPFLPFGAQPVKGSFFYLGYEELLYKDIDAINLQIQWLDAPQQFNRHYTGYDGTTSERLSPGDRSFSDQNVKVIQVQVHDHRTGASVASHTEQIGLLQDNPKFANDTFKANLFIRDDNKGTVALFNGDAGTPVTIPPVPAGYRQTKWNFFAVAAFTKWDMIRHPNFRGQGSASKKLQDSITSPALSEQDFASEELKTKFIRLELLRDFGHKEYPKVVANAALQQLTIPNAPYTPTIKTIALSYKASTGFVKLNSTDLASYTQKTLQFFYADVFGNAEQHGYLKSLIDFPIDKSISLVPQHRSEGEFYFSLEEIEPLTTVNVLMQLAEGTANPEKEARDISWFILCSNEWKLLTKENILSDATNHLLRSGIIKFYLPQEATDDNSILDSGKYWIKGVIDKDADAVCKFIDLHPQAALAIFDDEEMDVNHLAAPLPANSISKLATKDSAIKKITQPYASFEGRMKEDSISFYTRVSERLRHKQRAVAIWDYERLVLQQFPSIYKVKCLSHSSEHEECCSYRRPGQVTLVVVPDLQNKTPVDPLKPKAPLDTLTAIEDYLSTLNSMFVEVNTQNPEYEELLLDFKVRFKRNYEFGFYSKKLNDDLIRYLSPWAFSSSFEISFGGRVHKSVIMDFIEKLDYVDFITQFRMYHLVHDNSAKKDVNEIEVVNPSAILVSSAQHLINPVSENDPCE